MFPFDDVIMLREMQIDKGFYEYKHQKEETAMPCVTTPHPQHDMGKTTIKVLWYWS